MKIVFLNCMDAAVREPLAQFIEQHAKDTDMFCFQEAFQGMQQLADQVLGDYHQFSAYKQVAENDAFAQLTCVKKSWDVLASGRVLDEVPDGGIGLYVALKIGINVLTVCNVHGVWRPGDKLDTPLRLRQSRGLLDFFKGKTGQIVIGGDFNLMPETESLRMFREEGYRDLIDDYRIATTRNRLAWMECPDTPQFYADYIFLRDRECVRDFSVPAIEISDHLPLLLDIEVSGRHQERQVV